jgi:hypothetical protein
MTNKTINPTNGTNIRRLKAGAKPAFLNICQYGRTMISEIGMNSTIKTRRCQGWSKSPMIDSPSELPIAGIIHTALMHLQGLIRRLPQCEPAATENAGESDR